MPSGYPHNRQSPPMCGLRFFFFFFCLVHRLRTRVTRTPICTDNTYIVCELQSYIIVAAVCRWTVARPRVVLGGVVAYEEVRNGLCDSGRILCDYTNYVSGGGYNPQTSPPPPSCAAVVADRCSFQITNLSELQLNCSKRTCVPIFYDNVMLFIGFALKAIDFLCTLCGYNVIHR